MKARMMPRSSMPLCWKKRLSSAATNAFCTCSGMSASGTPDAAVVGLEDLGEALAACVEDEARAGQLAALEPRVVGQVGRRLVVEGDHLGQDRRTTASTVSFLQNCAIGAVQVAQVKPLQDLGVSGDRLRVVHGGRDQFVEIDVLDVERRRIWAQPSRRICATSAGRRPDRTASSPRPAGS